MMTKIEVLIHCKKYLVKMATECMITAVSGVIEQVDSMIKRIPKQLSSINLLIIPLSVKELAQTLVSKSIAIIQFRTG